MSDDQPVHLRCTRTGRVYRVVGFHPETKTITLKGKNGTFPEPLRPMSEFREIGYERIVGRFDGMIEA